MSGFGYPPPASGVSSGRVSAILGAGIVVNAARDGVTDDTAAIQAADDAASHGGTVIFPRGVYRTTATIHKSSTTRWLGWHASHAGRIDTSLSDYTATNYPIGSVIMSEVDGPAISIEEDSASNPICAGDISNITFVGGSLSAWSTNADSNPDSRGIYFTGVRHHSLNDIRIFGFGMAVEHDPLLAANVQNLHQYTKIITFGCHAGMYLRGADLKLIDCEVGATKTGSATTSWAGYGIVAEGCNNLQMFATRPNNCTDVNFHALDCNRILYVGGVCDLAGQQDDSTYPNAIGVWIKDCLNFQINGVAFYRNMRHILIESTNADGKSAGGQGAICNNSFVNNSAWASVAQDAIEFLRTNVGGSGSLNLQYLVVANNWFGLAGLKNVSQISSERYLIENNLWDGEAATASTTSLASAAHAINTKYKFKYKKVLGSDGREYRAQGSTTTSAWLSTDGSTTITPS